MSDGVNLAADLCLPDGPGPWPVVLTRTPYHRAGGAAGGEWYTSRGYAYVVQDVRGKHDSDGVFRPLEDEAADGQDTLSWVAGERWCNGRVGLVGKSYLGIVQIPAAAGGHESLKCILPGVAPNDFFTDWIRYDGCFALANMLRWPFEHASARCRTAVPASQWSSVWRAALGATLEDVEGILGLGLKTTRRWLEHDSRDAYWEALDQRLMYGEVGCPGLHQGGYFDHLSRGQFQAFRGISGNGATSAARDGQRLIVGPWGHSSCTVPTYGCWDFGPEAAIDDTAYRQRYLDLWLKEIDDGAGDDPAVRYFLMGENRWEHADTWPPAGVEKQSWYLSSSGGSGRLGREKPKGAESDRYTYDPTDPVTTRGGQVYWGLNEMVEVGPADQAPVIGRDDVLIYRSEVLGRPLRMAGDVELDLWFTSSAEDTDIVAKLCVVEPLGRVVVLSLGSLRARFRNSWSEPAPLPPGEPVRLQVQMNNLAYTFAPGTRIALIVTSSCFPRILPNPNTYTRTWAETKPTVAEQHVLHSPSHCSCVRLPVLVN